MKQKLLQCLMLIAVLLTSSHAFAHDFEVGGIYYNIISSYSKTCEVTYAGDSYSSDSNEYTGSIVIPETVTYNGTTYSVTCIDRDAFYDCTGLTSVIIPNSVISIGNCAFYNCIALKELRIEDGETTLSLGFNSYNSSGIGEGLFYDCPLETLYLGRNIKYTDYSTSNTYLVYPARHGYSAFYNIKKLKTVTIGNSVASIGNYAFYNCDGLTSATIPNSVTSIGWAAFYGCTGLTSITIPNSVTGIGSGAFYGCSGLTSITIPNSVTSIDYNAFSGCTGLTTIKVETGNSKYDSRNNCDAIIETESNTLIAGCKNTTIPNSVTSIGDDAFRSCTGLTSITIPNSVTSIGSSAFSGCSGLTSITIPNSVTSIGNYAFDSCSGLKELRIEDGESTLSLGDNSYSSSYIGEGLFYDCPLETLYLGRNLSYSSTKDHGYSPFYNQDKLKSVTIGNSVTSIGSSAFYKCYGLTNITIGNSVTSIGIDAFYGCSGLTTIKVETGNSKYDSRNNCNAIIETESNTLIIGCKNTIIPNSVTSIGRDAFEYCSGLTNITIPNSVTSIGSSAFRDCSGLTSLTIPNSVASIGNCAFYNCIALKELRIEDGETTLSLGFNSYNSSGIGEGLFYDCPLETLYLGRNIKYTDYNTSNTYSEYPERYGYSAFYNIKTLKSVTISNSVANIDNYVFNNCIALKELRIEDGETPLFFATGSHFRSSPLESLYLGRNLSYNSSSSSPFYNKNSLNTVIIGNSVTSISNYAFSGCTGLTSVTIPNSVTSIGNYAFLGCSGLKELRIEDGESTLLLGYNSYNYSYSSSYIGEGLFYDCPLETLYLGRNLSYSSTKDYGYSPFYNQDKLKSVTIGNSVTSIGNYAFDGCSGLTSVNISDVEAWCKIDFATVNTNPLYYAKNLYLNGELLTELVIPDSIKEIKNYAFYNFDGLTSITIPNSVTSIGSYAFFGCTGLCSIKMNATATTQTKLNFDITNNTEYEFCIQVNNKTYRSKDKTIEISELGPGNRPSEYGLIINDIFCKISSGSEFYTKSLNQNIQIETGIISINAKGSYTEGDATILGTGLGIGSAVSEYDNQNEKIFNNLDPNKSYTVYYSVNTKEGGVYSASKTFTTGALTWSDEEYQATSTTSARLMTATNCDATEGTGFEWRRYGAPENLKPNAVACPVIDGMLIGSLRNLNSEAYYEFRPYYTSSSGNKYYGEWTALFTGDANVYFEPEVRTYEDVKVVTNKATLKGYALAGTDDIISQGFEYWESSVQPGTANSLNASVNSKKVEVSGISMTAIVSDLKYGTTYCYRAFATTASGTIYGETVEFTTEKDLSGIENVIVEDDETVEYYNLQGVKIVNPSSGLYIKRQGNKVTKVIL